MHSPVSSFSICREPVPSAVRHALRAYATTTKRSTRVGAAVKVCVRICRAACFRAGKLDDDPNVHQLIQLKMIEIDSFY
jgi:hypothetical protein